MNEELKRQFYTKVASFEGFRSRPYKCPAGVLTIGYGHTDNVKITDSITLPEAQKLLREDMNRRLAMFSQCPFVLQEHELYALADFVFNLGWTTFKKSSFYPMLKSYSDALDNKNFSYADRLNPPHIQVPYI